uniref:Uncharacterized protein n=1 Tax=Latimeria chalumnae TaxID=7897 RepID=H3A0G6_LATCH
ISKSLIQSVTNVSIGFRVISDHAAVTLLMLLNEEFPAPPRWRLNAFLLQDKSFLQKLMVDIRDFLCFNEETASSKAILWDALKAFTRGKLLSRASFLKKQRTEQITNLEKERKPLEQQFATSPTDSLAKTLEQKKYALSILLSRKAEYALFYTHQHYFQQGECAFCLLAHRLRRCQMPQITGIRSATGSLVTAPKEICATFADFFNHLYSSESLEVEQFFSGQRLPTLNSADKEMLDSPIS